MSGCLCFFHLVSCSGEDPSLLNPHQVFKTAVSLIFLSRPRILGSTADNDEWFQDPHNHIC